MKPQLLRPREPYTVDGLTRRFRRTVYPMSMIPGRSKARLKSDLLELICLNDGKQWK